MHAPGTVVTLLIRIGRVLRSTRRAGRPSKDRIITEDRSVPRGGGGRSTSPGELEALKKSRSVSESAAEAVFWVSENPMIKMTSFEKRGEDMAKCTCARGAKLDLSNYR